MHRDRERKLEDALLEYVEHYGFLPKTRAFFLEDASDVLEQGQARLERQDSGPRPS